MRPCLPEEVQRAAEAAESRRDRAINQLLQELGRVPKDDEFETRMRHLIDADRNVVDLLKRKNG